MSELPAWRRGAATAVQRMPAPLRQATWDARRAAARAQRRRLERRGDFSQSKPAQFGMDDRLDALMGSTPGVFVEAGGFDGFTQSNTYFLERARGWTGLLIEPTPNLARAAQRERPGSRVIRCALVDRDYTQPTVELRYGGSKTIVEDPDAAEWVADAQVNQALDEPEHVFHAPARTLSAVLDETGLPEVDLLSLDVEGYEPQVLAGLDLDRHAPRWMLVEVDMRSPRSAIEALLGDRYRAAEQLSPHDVLFERR